MYIYIYTCSYRCIVDVIDLYPTCYKCYSYWTFPGVDLWVLVILFFTFHKLHEICHIFCVSHSIMLHGLYRCIAGYCFFFELPTTTLFTIRKTNLNPLKPSKTISNHLKLWVSFTSWTTLRQWKMDFCCPSKNAGFGGPSAGGCRKSPGAVSMMLREWQVIGIHWD